MGNNKVNNEISEIRRLELFLIELVKDLESELDGDKDNKIALFKGIRNIVNTMYFHPDYHNSDGFLWINE